jgi:hypothetical protein
MAWTDAGEQWHYAEVLDRILCAQGELAKRRVAIVPVRSRIPLAASILAKRTNGLVSTPIGRLVFRSGNRSLDIVIFFDRCSDLPELLRLSPFACLKTKD